MKILVEKDTEKPPVHRGYALVTQLGKFWSSRTMVFDEYVAGEPDMTDEELNELIQVLEQMWKQYRSAIKELRTLRK